jgi:hypothetical protein
MGAAQQSCECGWPRCGRRTRPLSGSVHCIDLLRAAATASLQLPPCHVRQKPRRAPRVSRPTRRPEAAGACSHHAQRQSVAASLWRDGSTQAHVGAANVGQVRESEAATRKSSLQDDQWSI